MPADVDVTCTGDQSIIPYAGQWKGKASVAEYFRAVSESVDVLQWNPQLVIGDADRVAAFGSMDLRVKSTGTTVVSTPWAVQSRVAKGKLAGWQVYVDTRH